MSEQVNPYQAPQSELINAEDAGDIALTEPQSRPIGDGWTWIADGFGLFKQSPGLWIGMIIVWLALMMVMSFVPLLGTVAVSVLGPVFMAGFMLGCRELEAGGEMSFNHLFAGFSQNTGQLILVGILYLVLIFVAMIPGMAVMFASGMSMAEGGNPADPAAMFSGGMAIGFLLMMALAIPVVMAYWFAPVLVALHDKSALEAMKLSFVGCLKNILPFLWYGIIAMILYVLALIPLGLGLLVMIPSILGSMYAAYRAIYTQK